jgi:exopolysaccharide production protein ExoY
MERAPQIARHTLAPRATIHARIGAGGGGSASSQLSALISAGSITVHSDSPSAFAVLRVPPWKRSLDIAFCVIALPALAIVSLYLALLTRVSSPGPLFFRQERVGQGGRRFKLYKFRTMHVRAETSSHATHFAELMRSNRPMQKMDARGDTRMIPTGRWLRAAGLDELPQIINVLRGEMSLVGPRPCIPYEFDQYSAEQKERVACVPGLTGLWQVSGKNRTTFEEMVRLDIAYCRQLSPWLDLKIIVMTVPAVCQQVVDLRRVQKAPAVAT